MYRTSYAFNTEVAKNYYTAPNSVVYNPTVHYPKRL